MILGFRSYCISLNNTCFYRSSRQVPTQQPIICCLSLCKNFFHMLVVSSLNCSYWWVLLILYMKQHMHIWNVLLLYTLIDSSLFCRWDPLLTLIIPSWKRELLTSPFMIFSILKFWERWVNADFWSCYAGTLSNARVIRLLYIFVQIQDFTQYLGNTVCVILIPSIRDAHHDFVFPQVCNFPYWDSDLI